MNAEEGAACEHGSEAEDVIVGWRCLEAEGETDGEPRSDGWEERWPCVNQEAVWIGAEVEDGASEESDGRSG